MLPSTSDYSRRLGLLSVDAAEEPRRVYVYLMLMLHGHGT